MSLLIFGNSNLYFTATSLIAKITNPDKTNWFQQQYMQAKEDMFDVMRPYVILINLATFIWFVALQYYRFKDTGAACSGDYLGPKLPANFNTIYLGSLG